MEEIRWQQRFNNYQKGLKQLDDAVVLSRSRPLSSLEQQGLIQAFEFTQELAWQVMKDYLEYQGETMITGSRDAIRYAFKVGLLTDGETWMDTIKSRNRSSHTYDENTANALVITITDRYLDIFKAFQNKMQELVSRND